MQGHRMRSVSLVAGLAAVAACATLPVWGEGVNAFSYIKKGLAACYDGIENASAGVHDQNATTWVDLTGNGNVLDRSSGTMVIIR